MVIMGAKLAVMRDSPQALRRAKVREWEKLSGWNPPTGAARPGPGAFRRTAEPLRTRANRGLAHS